MSNITSQGNQPDRDQTSELSLKGLSGKVAIYGGTFDPIHNGHLAIAKAAKEAHGFDKVIFVPTAHNPSKLHQPKATPEDRLAMLDLALRDMPYAFYSSEQMDGTLSNYTAELIDQIKASAEGELELHFLLGADNLEDLPGWRNPEAILEGAKCTVVNRPGHDVDTIVQKLRGKFRDELLDGVSERVVREANNPFSSTQVKNLLSKGRTPTNALPQAVLDYIERASLYTLDDDLSSVNISLGEATRVAGEVAKGISSQLEKTQETLKVGLSQRKFRATRFEDNFRMICEDIDRAVEQGVKRLIFPELTIPGYMSLDLFKNPAYIEKNLEFLKKVIAYTQDKDVVVIVGYARPGPVKGDGTYDLYNSADVIRNGIVLDTIDKTLLPAGDIFWERRYFEKGDSVHVTEIDGVKEGVVICEDLWDQDHDRRIAGELRQQGAERLWALNASPYYRGRGEIRHELLSSKAKTLGLPIAYANLVGAQDGYQGEIIFDGRSMIFDAEGNLTGLGETFSEDLVVVDIHNAAPLETPKWDILEELHDGIIMGFQDYFDRFGLKNAVIGISGGLDSALVAYFACKALGPDRVKGITMPMEGITGKETYNDAYLLADNLGFELKEVPIKKMWRAQEEMQRELEGASTGWRRWVRNLLSFIPGIVPEKDPVSTLTKENMQARIRGETLMNYSNNHPGDAVICPSNETEFWNFTIYGDSVGAFKPLGNIDKSTLYALAAMSPGIPEGICTRPPTAELMEGQTDMDVLPADYDVMSPLIRQAITPHRTREELIKMFEGKLGERTEEVIDITLRKIRGSENGFGKEWAHRQLPPSFRLTPDAVGAGRRVPYDSTFSG